MSKFLTLLVFFVCIQSFAETKNNDKDNTKGFSITKCSDDKDSPTSIEYYEGHKEYSKGTVKIFKADTDGEPACCSTHALLLIPKVNDEIGGFQCFHIRTSQSGGGAQSIDLNGIQSKYSPTAGLSLEIPFTIYAADASSYKKSAKILVDQKKGTVKLKSN